MCTPRPRWYAFSTAVCLTRFSTSVSTRPARGRDGRSAPLLYLLVFDVVSLDAPAVHSERLPVTLIILRCLSHPFVPQTKAIRPHLHLSRGRALTTEQNSYSPGFCVFVCVCVVELEELWRVRYVKALKAIASPFFFLPALSENSWHMSLIYPDSLTAN